MKLIGGRHMARPDRALLACLAAAGAVVGVLALLITGVTPLVPPPRERPADVKLAAERAAALERQRREVTHLRTLRTQYRWGIDNLRANQSYVQVELDRLRHERRLMPADDPARETLDRRLIELPELYRDYVENEARVRAMLGEVEAELAAREAALGPGGPGQ